ncbi:MAG: GNAT family protein [Chloroflexota bacterium]|nr:GNAT family protein [Chloroflexota bacterium]
MNPVKIETNGIVLRDWTLGDLESYAHWLQPGHRWQTLDGPYYKRPSASEIPELIARIQKRIETGDFAQPRQNLIIAEPLQNRMIGQVSRYWLSEETQWLAAGIVIYDPALWGKGYGTSALRLWTDYLFAAFPAIVRLDLQTWSGNAGMMRLATKLGYRLEGQFRKARIVAGDYYDSMCYGILREEWEGQDRFQNPLAS